MLPVQRAVLIKGPVLALVRRRLLDIGFALAGLGLALQFNVARFYENKVPPGGPLALLEGTYAVPFQYRVLVPLAVRGLLKVPTGLSFMWMYAAFDLAAVLGLCFVMRGLVLRFTDNLLYASVSGLGLFYVLPFNFVHTFWYPSDVPSVLFFALGLRLLLERKWIWYYPLFILATLNRETTIYLTLTQILVSIGTARSMGLWKHVVMQALLWSVIKGTLWFIYRTNPVVGFGLFENQLWANIEALADWPRLAAYLMNFGGSWIPVVIWQHKLAQPFLRRALLVCVVQMLVLGTVGVLDEMRVYGEIIPVVYLALVMLVWQAGGVAKLADAWQLKLTGLDEPSRRSGGLQLNLRQPVAATI